MTTKSIMYLGINLTKNGPDLYGENYKILKTHSMIWINSYIFQQEGNINMSVIHKLFYWIQF